MYIYFLNKNKLLVNNQDNRNGFLKNNMNEGGEAISENVKKIDKKKSLNDTTFILTCLKNHFVFYNLSEAELYFYFFYYNNIL